MLNRGTVRLILPRPAAGPSAQPGIRREQYLVRRCGPAIPAGTHRVAPLIRYGLGADGWGLIPMAGPPQFRRDTHRVFTELRRGVPHRYREVITYLPQAVYDPVETRRFHPDALTVSSGYFAIDSTDHGYAEFRFTLLHEVGHNVRATRAGTRLLRYAGEEEADDYALVVLAELRGG